MPRRLDAWMYPPALCSDTDPHPSHPWRDDWDLNDLVWCRGRLPITIGHAREGAMQIRSLREAEDWAEMCEQTPGGRQFLLTRDWTDQHAVLLAAAEEERVEREAKPWWRRLYDRWF